MKYLFMKEIQIEIEALRKMIDNPKVQKMNNITRLGLSLRRDFFQDIDDDGFLTRLARFLPRIGLTSSTYIRKKLKKLYLFDQAQSLCFSIDS